MAASEAANSSLNLTSVPLPLLSWLAGDCNCSCIHPITRLASSESPSCRAFWNFPCCTAISASFSPSSFISGPSFPESNDAISVVSLSLSLSLLLFFLALFIFLAFQDPALQTRETKSAIFRSSHLSVFLFSFLLSFLHPFFFFFLCFFFFERIHCMRHHE